MTRHLLLGAAMLLVGTSGAWAQSQTAQQPRPAPVHSYGGAGMHGATGHDDLMGIPAYISPNDPAYSYFEPIHRGQASESSAADSSWAGPYNQLGRDGSGQ